MKNITVNNFEEWRNFARTCCLANIRPEEINWHNQELQHSLFTDNFISAQLDGHLKVSPTFINFAKTISYHSSSKRWNMLYEALWRITHSEKHLLALSTDPLVQALNQMHNAVKRDAHKAKAFIRFKELQQDDNYRYVAWHEPDHRILKIIGPFFARRYSDMIWSVFTPEESMHWDLKALRFAEGSSKDKIERQDEIDELWKDYYRATFNPARIKIKAMKKEMPVRYWKNLPETSTITNLLMEAPARVEKMLKHTEGWHKSASDFIPDSHDIDLLRTAAKKCEGCPLYVTGTQTVFGEGLQNAKLMLVGEQPDDEDDRLGRPFTGATGKILDQALNQVALERKDLYLTHAVKHFEFSIINGSRQNITPNLRKIIDCNQWLQAEIKTLAPKVIVTLGVVSGRAFFGPSFSLKESMGKVQLLGEITVISTIHPSSVLRTNDSAQQEELLNNLISHLKIAKIITNQFK